MWWQWILGGAIALAIVIFVAGVRVGWELKQREDEERLQRLHEIEDLERLKRDHWWPGS